MRRTLRRSSALVGLATVALAGLVACGSSTPSASGQTTSPTPGATTKAPTTPKATTDPTAKASSSKPPSTPPATTYVTPALKLTPKPGAGEPGFRQITFSLRDNLKTVDPNLVTQYPQGIPISTGIPVKIVAVPDLDGYIRVDGYGVKKPMKLNVPTDIEFYAKKNGLFRVWAGRYGSPYPETLLFGLHVCPTCTP